jgi:hypothetical protein
MFGDLVDLQYRLAAIRGGIELIYNGINKCTLDAPTFAKKTLN